jgi:Na+/proline symporter
MGLMFNGLMKIPMQFFILFIGVMVFVSFQFNKPPIVFNETATTVNTEEHAQLTTIEAAYDSNFEEKKLALVEISNNGSSNYSAIATLQFKQDSLRKVYKETLTSIDKGYEEKDSDYIFLTFVLTFLPHGLIGLLLAVIFSAAMSSTAGELNALASTTTIDFYKKYWSKSDDEKKDLKISKLLTVGWGLLAIFIALTAGLFENLIQLVNILGSLFYGTILGVFLLAFFFKKVKAKAALFGGITGQIAVLIVHLFVYLEIMEVGFLMYNLIGSSVVIITALLIQGMLPTKEEDPELVDDIG